MNTKKHGNTLIELLVALAIVGFLVAMIASRLGGVTEDAAVVAALNEMKSIKEAIRGDGGKGFYPDLGLIPEDTSTPDKEHHYATRYLCLRDDSAGSLHPEYDEMVTFLSAKGKPSTWIGWDKHARRGWRGPYMEHDARYDAGGGDFFPVIATPWADRVEEFAVQAEAEGDTTAAKDYRKAKYYWILGEQVKNDARIVCLGPNGKDNGGTDLAKARNTSTPIGDDLVMFIFGGGPTRQP